MSTTGPKLKNLNQDHLLKKIGFSGQIRINSSYDNFSHKSAKLTKTLSHDHIY